MYVEHLTAYVPGAPSVPFGTVPAGERKLGAAGLTLDDIPIHAVNEQPNVLTGGTVSFVQRNAKVLTVAGVLLVGGLLLYAIELR